MFYVSEVKTTPPEDFKTPLRKKVYETLEELDIPYKRVDTDEAVSMADCVHINDRLDMDMVKTLFLSDRKGNQYYLLITKGDKKFDTREFSKQMDVPRVSFAPKDKFDEILGAKLGAATVFSALIDDDHEIQIVFDKDVVDTEFYGCSDGVNTGYMKIRTDDILNKVLPHSGHNYKVIKVK